MKFEVSWSLDQETMGLLDLRTLGPLPGGCCVRWLWSFLSFDIGDWPWTFILMLKSVGGWWWWWWWDWDWRWTRTRAWQFAEGIGLKMLKTDKQFYHLSFIIVQWQCFIFQLKFCDFCLEFLQLSRSTLGFYCEIKLKEF